MRNRRLVALMGCCLMLLARTTYAQARLTIVNQSQRQMTVKVMRAAGDDDLLYGTLSIAPMASQTIRFSETGDYFTKTMATLSGRDPIYQKGRPFRVYVGRDGYSVMTLTFTIAESAVPQVSGGQQISKEEFDRDSSKRQVSLRYNAPQGGFAVPTTLRRGNVSSMTARRQSCVA